MPRVYHNTGNAGRDFSRLVIDGCWPAEVRFRTEGGADVRLDRAQALDLGRRLVAWANGERSVEPAAPTMEGEL